MRAFTKLIQAGIKKRLAQFLLLFIHKLEKKQLEGENKNAFSHSKKKRLPLLTTSFLKDKTE